MSADAATSKLDKDADPVLIVVMGPSLLGKSTIGPRIAAKLDLRFEDGDQWHSQSNRDKMSSGQALTDDDRLGWLAELRAVALSKTHKEGVPVKGQGLVVACSALRRVYRDLLRGEMPEDFVSSQEKKDLIQKVAQKHDVSWDLKLKTYFVSPVWGEEDKADVMKLLKARLNKRKAKASDKSMPDNGKHFFDNPDLVKNQVDVFEVPNTEREADIIPFALIPDTKPDAKVQSSLRLLSDAGLSFADSVLSD